MMAAAVYGEGHLANVLVAELGLLRRNAPADLAFVAQDVTSHSDQSQMRAVETAYAQASSAHPYVVVVSQVPPGTTRRLAGGRVGVYYQVDTIIVDRAVERMRRPEQFVVGCLDPSEDLPIAYQQYLSAHTCPVHRMSYESAELAKCAINYALSKQIEAANCLAAVAAKCGASYPDVERALRGDARIGPAAYLRPGQVNQHLYRDVATILQMLREEDV